MRFFCNRKSPAIPYFKNDIRRAPHKSIERLFVWKAVLTLAADKQYGLAHNITDESVISEMLRLATELRQMIDEHKEKGFTTEYDL